VLHSVQMNRNCVYGATRVLFMFSHSLFLEPRKFPDIGYDHTHLNTESFLGTDSPPSPHLRPFYHFRSILNRSGRMLNTGYLFSQLTYPCLQPLGSQTLIYLTKSVVSLGGCKARLRMFYNPPAHPTISCWH
jgi:hypothetical protein